MIPPREHIPGSVRSAEREYDLVRGILGLWDLTKNPRTNVLEDKLGKADKTRGGAILKIGEEEKDSTAALKGARHGRNVVADGITNKRRTPGVWPFNPDDHVLRLFGPASRRRGYWGHRLSIDATNPSWKKENRGVMVFDHELSQMFGFLSDALRVAAPGGGADIPDPELWFTGAGFLAMLYEENQVGVTKRGAVAVSIHKNLGFTTDGAFVGQWAHIVAWLNTGNATAVAGRPSTTVEMGLQAALGFKWPDGQIACLPRLEQGPKSPKDEGQEYLVHFHKGKKIGRKIDVSSDPQSNHKEIPAKEWEAIEAYVKVPPPYLPVEKKPCNPDTPTPPSEPSTDVPTPPVAGSAAPFTGVPTGMPGVPVAFTLEIPVPRDIPNMTSIDVDMQMAISVAYGKGQSTELQISTQTAKNCNPGSLSAPSWEGKSVTSVDALHTDTYRTLRKSIPASQLQDKDRVILTVWQMSTSTGPVPTMLNPTARPGCALPIPPSLPRFL